MILETSRPRINNPQLRSRNGRCKKIMILRVQMLSTILMIVTLVPVTVTALTIPKTVPNNSHSHHSNNKHYLYNNVFVSTNNKVTGGPAGAATESTAATSMMMTNEDIPDPSTFREAEVLGLRLMQEGNFEDALVAFQRGMKLPGSRPDVVRTRSNAGPSPVGGSYGGTDSQKILALDDFELQAVYYNMACAHSRLGNISESIANLENAFKIGFTNFSTVRADPDLDPVKQDPDFDKLLESYDGNDDGFNPFGLFSSKK